MKESWEELYSFWCVSVGLTVSLSFVLSFLCGLSFALYLLSGAGGVQWNWNTGKKEKKGGGVEDEFPVCECASGVKSLAYLPPLFHFSFCDRWGMLAAIYSWIFACLAGNMPRQSCYVKGPIEEQGPYYSDLRYFQQFIFCWNLFYLDRCLLMHRQILLFAISLSAMAFR